MGVGPLNCVKDPCVTTVVSFFEHNPERTTSYWEWGIRRFVYCWRKQYNSNNQEKYSVQGALRLIQFRYWFLYITVGKSEVACENKMAS